MLPKFQLFHRFRDPSKLPAILRGDRRRAFLALLSCSAVFLLVSAAVGAYLLGTPSEQSPERAEFTFRLFTVLSNLLSAVGCFLSIPFAVEGVRKTATASPSGASPSCTWAPLRLP
ncbi:MAG: hypothetical protein IJG53_06595 [Eggerthellaceae bacterium]|nr:hypothetical protein [Eggerthellaceae bacterium]